MNVTACVSRLIKPRHELRRALKALLTFDGVRNAAVAFECRSLGKYKGEQ